MITFIFFFIFFSMLNLLNPVKFSVFVLALGIFNFYIIFELLGSSWFPLVFILLFAGGILILFMIISSIYPNEKSLKLKFSFFFFFLVSFFSFFSFFDGSFNFLFCKSSFFFGFNIFFLFFLILCYFMIFIFFVSKENFSLRCFF